MILESHDVIAKAIQETNHDVIDGAYCTGYVVIAEWVSPDGNRWLSHMAGSPAGPGLPVWQVKGYLHESLYCPALPDSDEDDEPE